jgi:hypothetical protein
MIGQRPWTRAKLTLTGRKVLSLGLTPARRDLYVSHRVAALAREEILTLRASVRLLMLLGICLTDLRFRRLHERQAWR